MCDGFIETSAKNNDNVTQLFSLAASICINKRRQLEEDAIVYEDLRQQLLTIVTSYKENLKAEHDRDPVLPGKPANKNNFILKYKINFIYKIEQKLDKLENKSVREKIKAIKDIHQMLTEKTNIPTVSTHVGHFYDGKTPLLLKQNNDEPVISLYRDRGWQTFIKNLACVAAFVFLPVAIIAAFINKTNYDTFRFWKPYGFKVKEQLLNNIDQVQCRRR